MVFPLLPLVVPNPKAIMPELMPGEVAVPVKVAVFPLNVVFLMVLLVASFTRLITDPDAFVFTICNVLLPFRFTLSAPSNLIVAPARLDEMVAAAVALMAMLV